MEYISSSNLDKYKTILDQIDNEYKRHEILKKQFEKKTNELVAVRLTTEKYLLSKDVFKVFLKVYDSVFDLFFLYGDESSQLELETLAKYRDCKFYVVEVNVSQTFLSRKFILHSCVKNSTLSICKSVSVKKKRHQHVKGPHLIVIPFDCSAEDVTVTTTLYVNNDNMWSSLHLSTITVDVSYHFTTRHCLFKDDPVIKIAKQYNRAFVDNVQRQVEYNFKCKCTTKHFFESVVKNCYHRLNPEVFTVLNNENTPHTSVEFYVRGDRKATVKLDKKQDILTVLCDVYDLCAIKKYFIDQIEQEQIVVNKTWLHSFTVCNFSLIFTCLLKYIYFNANLLRQFFQIPRRETPKNFGAHSRAKPSGSNYRKIVMITPSRLPQNN
ncbi:hypothetical protein RI129_010618 [Pyrocoelia pectoralis]|uniref:Uncharacterized protein n=1 Tax=Pyrocoelia pectoralis TaxID=417401 RepID=A0AAN7V287_9COLE